MKDGKMVLDGSVDEIMDSQKLSDIFDTKIDIIKGPYGKMAVYN